MKKILASVEKKQNIKLVNEVKRNGHRVSKLCSKCNTFLIKGITIDPPRLGYACEKCQTVRFVDYEKKKKLNDKTF